LNSLKVGFIGVGNMGMAMAKPLVKKGFQVTVRDLNLKAVEEITALGAKTAISSRELAENSDVIITMVRDIEQTDEVLFGKEGAWEGLQKNAIIMISNSIGPEYCRNLYEKAKMKGIHVVDCAVSDPSGALHPVEGGLTLMIGGDEEDVKKCWPIFEAIGKNIFHLGGIGMGQMYKLINNLATFNIGMVNREVLNFGLKAGLDLEKMTEVICASTGGSWGMWFQGQQRKARKQRGSALQAPPRNKVGKNASVPLEKRLAAEMARKVGAQLPIDEFLSNLDIETVYADYLAKTRA
jgi:3-hydroxyisobutyrate dehydrogenase-like beta-hydroxyacid dehydrogenase